MRDFTLGISHVKTAHNAHQHEAGVGGYTHIAGFSQLPRHLVHHISKRSTASFPKWITPNQQTSQCSVSAFLEVVHSVG